jgi:hypothetical protein
MPDPILKKGDTKLLLALACGASVENAARQSGLTERTVYRRLKDPAFKDKINAVRREMLTRAAGAMTAAAMESVKTLLDLQKPNQPGAVRLGAARSILEIGIKMREVTDIEEQMAQVKELLTNANLNGAATMLGALGSDLQGNGRIPVGSIALDAESLDITGGLEDGAGQAQTDAQ